MGKGCTGALGLVLAGYLSGCGVMQHRLVRSYQVVDATDYRVDSSYVQRVDAHLEVTDIELRDVDLTGRVRATEWCVRVSVGSHRVEERETRHWVDGNGERASLAGIGTAEIGTGALLPLLVPACMAGLCGDNDDPTPRSMDAETFGQTMKVGAIAGAILGGLAVIGGIVDLAADGSAGPTGRTRVRRASDVERSPPYRCRGSGAVPEGAELRVGRAVAPAVVAPDGAFTVDLRALWPLITENPAEGWDLLTADGRRAPIELSLGERLGVAVRLAAHLGPERLSSPLREPSDAASPPPTPDPGR